MQQPLAAKFLGCLLLILGAGTSVSQEKPDIKSNKYYPTAVGTVWEYSANGNAVTVRVAKHEEINGRLCAKLETLVGEQIQSVEYIHVSDTRIERVQLNGADVEPPWPLLKIPVIAGDQWKSDSQVQGTDLKGQFEVSFGEITVAAGKFTEVCICDSNTLAAGNEITNKAYYAPGVGLVKQITKIPNGEILLELKKYQAGAASGN